jgi:hypothetical protein
MKTRTHFAHRIDMLDAAGEIQEHLAGVEDYILAEAVWREAIARWPGATIILRQGARVIRDSRRLRVVKWTADGLLSVGLGQRFDLEWSRPVSRIPNIALCLHVKEGGRFGAQKLDEAGGWSYRPHAAMSGGLASSNKSLATN